MERDVNDLVQEIMGRWDWDNPHVKFDYQDLHVVAHWVDGTDEDPPELILVHKQGDPLVSFAYEVATTWFSEATNNDACKIEIVEQTAHFDEGSGLTLGDVLVTVKILDDVS